MTFSARSYAGSDELSELPELLDEPEDPEEPELPEEEELSDVVAVFEFGSVIFNEAFMLLMLPALSIAEYVSSYVPDFS